MVCKIFVYEDKEGNKLYLNGADFKDNTPLKMIELYINWYNSEFAPFEKLPLRKVEDFNFIESFCPIDFYDESLKR